REVVHAADARAGTGDETLLPGDEVDERVLLRIQPAAERGRGRCRPRKRVRHVKAGEVAFAAGQRGERVVGAPKEELEVELRRACRAQRLEREVVASLQAQPCAGASPRVAEERAELGAHARVRLQDALAEGAEARRPAPLHLHERRAEQAGGIAQQAPGRAVGERRGGRGLAQRGAAAQLAQEAQQRAAALARQPAARKPRRVQRDLDAGMQALAYWWGTLP